MSPKKQYPNSINTIPKPNERIDPPTLSKQVQPIQASGLVALEMVSAFKSGLMVHAMKVNGKITGHMGKASSFMWMGIFMKATGSMIRLMGMESIYMLMGQGTKVNGRMTCNMEGVRKHGLMGLFMKDSTTKARNMDSESIAGMMDHAMKENGMRIRSEA